MRKLTFFGFLFSFLGLWHSPAQALDPYAGSQFDNAGMIHVQTPDPSKDEITLTNLRTHKIETLKSGKLKIVPAGTYRLKVVMEGEIDQRKVTIRPTERTDIVIGYGKLKVVGPRSTLVQVFDKKAGNLIAEFPASQTQLLPRGKYDVKVQVKGIASVKSDVLVVGSKTSVVKVRS